jgi:hypothetical protein
MIILKLMLTHCRWLTGYLQVVLDSQHCKQLRTCSPILRDFHSLDRSGDYMTLYAECHSVFDFSAVTPDYCR